VVNAAAARYNQRAVRYLDPRFWISNPFVPWDRIWAGVILAIYIYIIYWTYRDAQRRYFNGVWFATLAALLPFAGWLFYLFYRNSSLVEFDTVDTHERFFDRIPEVEYDLYLAYARQESLENMYAQMKQFFLGEGMKEEAATSTYPEHIMRSRERELVMQREHKVRENYEKARKKVRSRLSVLGSTARRVSSPMRVQLEEQLNLLDKLTEAPIPDRELEELIYQGRLKLAKMYAEDQLLIAKEQNDERRINSYKYHLRRVEELIQREQDGKV
jgi:hypothetical protein